MQQQALRLGLLAGQALERSDNPAIVCRNVQPLRVGLSKISECPPAESVKDQALGLVG